MLLGVVAAVVVDAVVVAVVSSLVHDFAVRLERVKPKSCLCASVVTEVAAE